MRDDARPVDAFAWTRPWVPYGDDPFVWYDPAQDIHPPAAAPANDAGAPQAAIEAVASAPTVKADSSPSGDEIWVELPAAEDKPKRRRSRGRVRGDAEALAEPPVMDEVVVAEPETPAVVAPDLEPPTPAPRARPSRRRATPAAAAEVGPDPAPPPPSATVTPIEPPTPEPAPLPDPAEISAPPPAPRRGWWRR